MKIAFDLDEVLAHFLPAFIKYHNDQYQTEFTVEEFTSYHFWDVLGGTMEETMEKVYDFHATEYFDNIEPIEEAFQAIKELKDLHELVIITSRQLDIQDQTYEWIDTHFPDTFSEIYFANHHAFNNGQKLNKADICKELRIEALIEDSLEYSLECAPVVKKIYLLDQPWNQSKKLPSNIERVYGWERILQDLL